MGTAGVEPRIMGFGPAPATHKLCNRLGLKPSDFDVIELNEAFASQGIAVLRDLDVVQREEFEAVKAMAQKAREENELLKSRIAALEAKGKGKKGK